jgi:two-component sensor histidine kinase
MPGTTGEWMIFRYDNERDKIFFSETLGPNDRGAFERHIHAIQEECGVSGHYDRIESVFRELANANSRLESPIMFYDDSGTRIFKCHLLPEFDGTGKIVSIICISQDITEMMNIIDTVCVLQKEKETILRELHDRVKNNLQIIESLLRLQADRIHDFNYYSLYENYVNRIHSIALIQNRLYQENNMEMVDIGAYIGDYIETIRKNSSYDTKNIQIDYTTDIDRLELTVAIPCALIINELVTNSLQHAFPNERPGRISILFSWDFNEMAHVLEISDNGIGLPEHVDCYNPSSMGFELVQALVRQIKGKLMISRSDGTRYRIRF